MIEVGKTYRTDRGDFVDITFGTAQGYVGYPAGEPRECPIRYDAFGVPVNKALWDDGWALVLDDKARVRTTTITGHTLDAGGRTWETESIWFQGKAERIELFQDTECTVPAAAPGDLVAAYKTTDGLTAIQPDPDKRPTVMEFSPDEFWGTPEDDGVSSPAHYTVGGFEALDVIKAKLTPEEYRGYLKGNILKYLMRANYKNDHDKDCKKAAYYGKKLEDSL